MVSTADPCFADTHTVQTPHYYRQFSLFLGKALSFSLYSTCLIRTPRQCGHWTVVFAKYSRLSLSRHLYETVTSVKRTPRVGPCLSLLPLFDSL